MSTAVATADSWLATALKQSLTGAVSLPLATSLYFVRFLDLRRRRDGYDREQLADDLRKRDPRPPGDHRTEPQLPPG
ncbi:hypothetical protein [Parasphingorhabdus pacifica]